MKRRRMQRNARKRRGGFTLMEVMLVLVIISLIAGIGTVAVLQQQKKALRQTAANQIEAFKTPLMAYAMDFNGQYPSTLLALYEAPSDLADPSQWGGKYIDEPPAKDPWGAEYNYELDGESYRLWSNGPDGIEGTEDDVCSWTEDE